jgi:hypothetical protein
MNRHHLLKGDSMRVRSVILAMLAALVLVTPPAQAITSPSGGCAAANSSSVALPTHATGDLILIHAFDTNGSAAPSLAAGYTSAGTETTTLVGSRIGYKIAASSSETSGTWSGAERIVACIYSGVDQADPIGAVAVSESTSSNTIIYAALTLEVTDGSSWVWGTAGHNAANDVEQAPTGMTNRAASGTGPEIVAHDTNGGVASWSAQNVGVNNANHYISWTVEIRAAGAGAGCVPTLMLLGVGGC